MKFTKNSTLFFLVTVLISCNSSPKNDINNVSIVGEMKNVIFKGELSGNILLDTLSNKQNIFGLGPLEFLKGEITIINGVSYVSKVLPDSSISIEKTFNVKAPFFGFANIVNWKEVDLPNSVKTIIDIEKHLDKITKKRKRPFLFKINGIVNYANFHIVNLPDSIKVNSPKKAHIGQVNYNLVNEEVEIIGFFSTDHKSIFTHHDTFLHMHIISKNKDKMGHLDNLELSGNGVKLYLPN